MQKDLVSSFDEILNKSFRYFIEGEFILHAVSVLGLVLLIMMVTELPG